MCIRDRVIDLSRSTAPEHREALSRLRAALDTWIIESGDRGGIPEAPEVYAPFEKEMDCLLYTSDAADERSSVDLGGRRIIKKKKKTKNNFIKKV